MSLKQSRHRIPLVYVLIGGVLAFFSQRNVFADPPLTAAGGEAHSQAIPVRPPSPTIDFPVDWVIIEPEMVSDVECYKDSVAPGTLRLACLPSEDQLKAFFKEMGIPFETQLERHVNGKVCHIFYKPTISGFHVSPEDAPVEKLVFNLESAPFVSEINADVGDPLSIARAILSHVKRPLDVELSVSMDHKPELYAKAKAHFFGQTPHRITLRDSKLSTDDSGSLIFGSTWPQDYLKAGYLGKEPKLLLARKFCENGEGAQKAFEGGDGVRSQLGWQGGDLQFVKSPKDGKVTLVYGDAARDMWGKNLSQEEVGYILQQEFGADNRVYVGGVTPHVDYFVSFLPHERLAIVSEPVPGNIGFFCDASQKMLEYIANHSPEPIELKRLQKMVCVQKLPLALAEVRDQAAKAINEFSQNEMQWEDAYSKELQAHYMERILSYLKAHFGTLDESAGAQLGTAKGFDELLRTDPQLARDFLLFGLIMGNEHNRIFDDYREILERELGTEDPSDKASREEKKQQIENLGFDVIRVPGVPGGSWAGVSYANNVLIDKTLFLPTFGLGTYEKSIVDGLSQRLSAKGIEVVPVNVTYSMDENGAVHCRTALIRRNE